MILTIEDYLCGGKRRKFVGERIGVEAYRGASVCWRCGFLTEVC